MPSWDLAIKCNYGHENEFVAGPKDGTGEGVKYTVPSLGPKYFISLPTPCISTASSPVTSFDLTAPTCCQKLAVMAAERQETIESSIEGTWTLKFFFQTFS